MIPVLGRPGEATEFESENQTDVVHRDLGEQSLKARPVIRGPAAPALILVDHQNPVSGPAERRRVVGEGVLPLPGFGVIEDLLGTGLADVHDRELVEMTVGNQGRPRVRDPRRGRGARVDRDRGTRGRVRGAHASPPVRAAVGPGAGQPVGSGHRAVVPVRPAGVSPKPGAGSTGPAPEVGAGGDDTGGVWLHGIPPDARDRRRV